MKTNPRLTFFAIFMLLALAGLAACGGSSGGGSDSEPLQTDEEDAGSALLMINEIVAKAADDGYDWIEFYVSGNQTISLSDYTVVDDNGDRQPAALPDVILSPGDFYVIYATDEAPADGSGYVAFKLGSSDSVTLFQGDDPVDQLEWDDADAPRGFSYGRYPDGSGDTRTLQPTRGGANEALTFFSGDTVESIYIEISDSDWQDMLANPLDEAYHPAAVTYQGVTLEDVAFRTKGNSSLRSVADMNSERYSFKVDMNYYVNGQKLLNIKKINLDSYQGPLAHNYYIYEQNGVFSVIPWDLNEAFGTFRMGCQDADSMISFYIDEPTAGAVDERPLISRLLARDSYRETYHDDLQELIDGPMRPDVLWASIQETKTLIQAHVANDTTAFYSYAQFEASLGTETIDDIFGLQDFIDRRTAHIRDQLDGVAASEGDGSGNCTGAGLPAGPPGP